MSIHVICVTSDGGLPIFNRKKGDCENLPFSTIGSLNGVHMFCKSQNVDLQSTDFEDGLIVWKEYENSLLLIGIAKEITEKVFRKLLDFAFSTIVFFIGLNELKNCQNIERLKREVKNCYPLIDKLLEQTDSELITLSDCIICPENNDMMEKLIEFSEQIGSPFCCLFIRQKIAVATNGWWQLDIIDRKLLSLLLSSLNSMQKDIPVYLPHKSPNIAYRLVSIPLLQNVNLCVLCGAEPPYLEIENLAKQIWRNDFETLQLAEQCFPRNFPESLELDTGILGILLINKSLSKYVISRNIQHSSSGKRTISGTHRLDILRTFFHQAIDVIDDFIQPIDNSNDNENENQTKHLESYWCSDYHKCHAFISDDNLICVLYVAAIPTHTMRIITQKTLNLILAEKDICW